MGYIYCLVTYHANPCADATFLSCPSLYLPSFYPYTSAYFVTTTTTIVKIMYFIRSKTHHTRISYLYNMRFLGVHKCRVNNAIVISQSQILTRKFGVQIVCHYIEVVVLSNVVLKKEPYTIIIILPFSLSSSVPCNSFSAPFKVRQLTSHLPYVGECTWDIVTIPTTT